MISKINSFSPAFEVVKKSAYNKAVNAVGNDSDELRKIQKYVKKQNNNQEYDIEYVNVNPDCAFLTPYDGYGVIERQNGHLINYFPFLQAACAYAGPSRYYLCPKNKYEILDTNLNNKSAMSYEELQETLKK